MTHCSSQVASQNRWMYITFAADGRRIPKLSGKVFYGLDDILLGLFISFECAGLAQRHAGQHGPCPRSEIFSRKIRVTDLAEVFVDICGIDCVGFALAIDVLKELVSLNILAPLNNPCQSAILDIDCVPDTALSLELEGHRGSFHLYMTISQSG